MTQVTNLLSFAILGKYFLEPKDFGLVAMVVVLTGFAAMFTEFGLGAALIQKQEIKESHKSSVFWLSIALGLLAFGMFIALRTAITSFYQQPILYEMIGPLAFTLVLASASSVHVSLLRKELRFKALTIVSVAADVISFLFAIWLASEGAGPWSLVGKAVALRLLSFVAIWAISSWRPQALFCLDSIKEVFNFGASYFGTRAFSYAAVKIDHLMIGRYVGDSALGLYSNAFKIVLAPINLIKNQIIGVFFPALSSIQSDKPRVKAIAIQLMGVLAMAGFPVLFFIAVVSGDLIGYCLPPRWENMKLMVILLAFVAMAEISVFPGVIFLSQGRADGYLKLMLGTKSVSSIGIIIGVLNNGVTGLLFGMLIAAIANFVPYLYFSGRLIGMNLREQLLVNAGPFLIAAVPAALLFVADYLVLGPSSTWVRIGAKFLFYFGVVGLGYFAFRPFPLRILAGRVSRYIVAKPI